MKSRIHANYFCKRGEKQTTGKKCENERRKNVYIHMHTTQSLHSDNDEGKKGDQEQKTIFDIKFVNTISFQSCMNIYTRVYEKCICNMSVREREPQNNRMLVISAHRQAPFACPFVCVRSRCTNNLHLCKQKLPTVFILCTTNAFRLVKAKAKPQKQTKKKRRKMGRKNPFLKFDCTMIFLLAFTSSVIICFCCRCSYIGLCAIKHKGYSLMESHVAAY